MTLLEAEAKLKDWKFASKTMPINFLVNIRHEKISELMLAQDLVSRAEQRKVYEELIKNISCPCPYTDGHYTDCSKALAQQAILNNDTK